MKHISSEQLVGSDCKDTLYHNLDLLHLLLETNTVTVGSECGRLSSESDQNWDDFI